LPAYYNEHEPYAAQWLRNLIKEGLIAPGDVDERSIVDVRPSDLAGYEQCHFFAGIGVWSYALRRAGWPDHRTVWTGSCPCQPHSGAASDRKRGFSDARDLWGNWFYLISECRPPTVFGEQVDDSASWIDRMQSDMEAEGFAVGTIDFPACAVDAPQERMRTYFVAHDHRAGFRQPSGAISVAPQHLSVERSGRRTFFGDQYTTGELGKSRRTPHEIRLLADVDPGRVGRLRAYGNALCAEAAVEFIKAAMP